MSARSQAIHREAQLKSCIPDVLNYKTALYIGARPSRKQIAGLLAGAGYAVYCLEIWPPNVAALREQNAVAPLFREILEGDARNAPSLGLGVFDVIIWWHGPEHIGRTEIEAAVAGLKGMTRELLILACPNGEVGQGPARGNPNEEHKAYLLPENFEALGFKTNTIGSRGRGGSNILAWWRPK